MAITQQKILSWWKKNSVWLIAVLLSLVFIISRVYRIEQSLLYFIDMGRDSNVLLTWQETGKPPLLGPQTSVLPFNQSAGYFYGLMPLFVLLKGSPFAAIYTTVVIYLAVFWWMLWVFRGQKRLAWLVLGVWFLVVVQPQFVIQNRFVWNPSWVAPAILVGLTGLIKLRQSLVLSWRWLVVMGLGFGGAVGLSYSAIPVFLSVCLLSIWWWKKSVWKVWLSLAVGLAVMMAPTVFFEVRHAFPLTKMMLTQKPLAQTETSLVLKLGSLAEYVVASPTRSLGIGLLFLTTLASLFWYREGENSDKELSQVRQLVSQLLWVTTFWLLVLPVSLLSHYIFGFAILWLWSLVLLPRRVVLLLMVVLLSWWCQPARLQAYIQPARRTVAQMQACFAQVCQQVHEPLFVSVQAGFHPFHAAQEHRYLLRQAGCQVPELDQDFNAAQLMAVVVDDSQYQHGSTAYNELTQFGPATESGRINCQENFQVVLIRKQP